MPGIDTTPNKINEGNTRYHKTIGKIIQNWKIENNIPQSKPPIMTTPAGLTMVNPDTFRQDIKHATHISLKDLLARLTTIIENMDTNAPHHVFSAHMFNVTTLRNIISVEISANRE